MEQPFRTETIETPAGEYTIKLYPDDDAMNPLEDWDHPGMAFYVVHGREGVVTDSLDDADDRAANALRTWINEGYHVSDIERRFALWRAITGSSWLLVTGSSYDSQASYGWMALVDSAATYLASDGKSYPCLPQPIEAVKATMGAYERWAQGYFCGYVVEAPNGDHVDSLWSIDDEDYAIEEAKSVVKLDAERRIAEASRDGAGFVGLL